MLDQLFTSQKLPLDGKTCHLLKSPCLFSTAVNGTIKTLGKEFYESWISGSIYGRAWDLDSSSALDPGWPSCRIPEQRLLLWPFTRISSIFWMWHQSLFWDGRGAILGTPRTRPMRSSRSPTSWRSCFIAFVGYQIHHCQRQADLFSGKVFFRDQHGRIPDP